MGISTICGGVRPGSDLVEAIGSPVEEMNSLASDQGCRGGPFARRPSSELSKIFQ